MNGKRPVASRIRVRTGEGGPPSVDGHPGWVRQSVRQYRGLCVVTIGMHAFFTGVGPVLSGARSAAWWIVALGSLGGLLIWLPLWGMLRGEKAISFHEAMAEAYGKTGGGIITMLYAALAIFDTNIAIRVIGSVVRQYLIADANEMFVSLAVVVVLMITVYRHGDQGLSRLFWLVRWIIVFALVFSCFSMLQNAYVENLYPLLGSEVKATFSQLPAAASGFIPILALGILPMQTGSAKPIRFRTGLIAVAVGGLIATALMLVVNVCMPPRAVMDQIVWGVRLALSAEYMQSRMFRMVYLLTIMLMTLLASGFSAAASISWMQSALGMKNQKIPLAVCGVCFIVMIFLSNQQFTEQVARLLQWRLPIAVVPVWITWGVLCLKRRKGAAKG